jgi:hypothetical protein
MIQYGSLAVVARDQKLIVLGKRFVTQPELSTTMRATIAGRVMSGNKWGRDGATPATPAAPHFGPEE